ncbi:hypothetical protein MKX03_032132 [Papaver bracteatum]|nr:hypothetical protein MKX03_032132 [Papaver bracteatum]
MPAKNRVHCRAALQTHDEPKQSSSSQPMSVATAADPDAENAYNSFQRLLALARITGRTLIMRLVVLVEKAVMLVIFIFSVVIFSVSRKRKMRQFFRLVLVLVLDIFKVNGDSFVVMKMEMEIAALYVAMGKRASVKSKTRSLSKKKDDEEGGKKTRKVKKRRHDGSSDEDDKRRHRHRKSRKEKRRRSHHDSDDYDSSEESKRRHKCRHRKKASSSSDVSL